ncbi:MAG: signal recognition particle-docking protein FtsY [Acidobacteria bacterium]|nr:MAG: signal recognition particle-docking protein FtsY [Acidobacteriota bacterium]
MSSFFSKVRDGLAKTAARIREVVTDRPVSNVQRPASGHVGRGTLDDGRSSLSASDIEEALVSADVGLAATERILGAVKQSRADGTLQEKVAAEIKRVFDDVSPKPATGDEGPRVILIVGVNGTGKTTSVGKLANLFKSQGRSVLVCAADTFRAAAVEQLAIWAERAGVEVIRAQHGADPASVVHDAAAAATARHKDILLIDTAGRLHTRANLMAELDKIRRVVSREIPGAPHEVLLVLDATVGQNGLVQAREFMAAGGVNGLILTKLDGTAKGGVAVAIAHELKLPIRFIGVGEGVDDLVPFDADDYVNALFASQWT